MPLNEKGRKILRNMRRTYGRAKGASVFYASERKGTIKNVAKRKGVDKPVRTALNSE